MFEKWRSARRKFLPETEIRTEDEQGMEKRRYRYLFYGRVQGVGFRYKARHLADRYGLTGFVRNEYDGSVTAEVQGPKTAIGVWMQCLNQDPYIRIDSFERKDLDLREGEECFSVRH